MQSDEKGVGKEIEKNYICIIISIHQSFIQTNMELSAKNTKNEILAAYEELLQKTQESRTEEPKKVQEKQIQETAVKNAAASSYEGIVKNMSNLKIELSSSLDKLGDKFVSEFKKFEELQQAIQIEKKTLEDLYQLSANTDSLSVMMLVQKEKKQQYEEEMTALKSKFEVDMTQTRLEWKKEQEETNLKLKEEADFLKKNRQREEEDYQYNLKLNRKKETDLYEEKKLKSEKELADKKTAFEKEFATREAQIKNAESELAELKVRTEAFPAELEKAMSAAVKNATEKLKAEYGFERELTAKQMEGDLKLKEQSIQTLQSKIKDMELTMKELTTKANTAEASVKDIAIKAIESSSKIQLVEKSKEQ